MLSEVTLPDGDVVVNMLSGGGGSWAAGRRLVDQYGSDRVAHLFTDVKGADGNPHTGEHPDTYRFLHDAAADLGGEFVYLQDGRDIWDVFLLPAVGWLGNAKLAHCSWFLKTLPAREWLDANRDPAHTLISVGMDWTETQRHAGVHKNYAHTVDGCAAPKLCRSLFTAEGRLPGPGCKNLLPTPWRVIMPMNQRPKIAKPQVLALMAERGLKPPQMYAMGFAHANCPACVKGGQAHWKNLWETAPDTYLYAEQREAEFRESRPSRANATILKETVDKVARPLPLSELRRRLEALGDEEPSFDLQFDFGGCGCANEAAPAELTLTMKETADAET